MAESAVIRALEKELRSAEAFVVAYQRQVEAAIRAVVDAESYLQAAREGLQREREKLAGAESDVLALRMAVGFHSSGSKRF